MPPKGRSARRSDVSEAGAPLWQVRRRPRPRLVIFTAIIAAIGAAGGAWLAMALMIEPDRRLAVVMGAGIFAATMASLLRGCSCAVDAQGVLTYGWGAGADLRLSLRDVAAVRHVDAGMLVGVGLDIAPERVEFLRRRARAGIQRVAGQARPVLVLEHLRSEDAAVLDRLRGETSEG